MNIVTELGKCFKEDDNGNLYLKVTDTATATDKLENWQSKLRKSIDTTNNKLRVVSTHS